MEVAIGPNHGAMYLGKLGSFQHTKIGTVYRPFTRSLACMSPMVDPITLFVVEIHARTSSLVRNAGAIAGMNVQKEGSCHSKFVHVGT